MSRSPVHLVRGGDEVLLAEGARELVDRLLEGRDRTEVLDEFSGDDYDPAEVAMAATTVSMFGSRVVVARNLARCTVEQLAPLLGYLEDPSPDTELVLVWDRPVMKGLHANPVPKKLVDAVTAAGGEVHDHGAPANPKGRAAWIDDQLRASGVRLEPAARRLLGDRLGEDVARLGGIMEVLRAVHGDRTVSADELGPYLGAAGSVPPWDLTDAIDAGDVALALTNLRRLLDGGARHPLQVMVTLQQHVERMVRLDGAAVGDEKDAARLLGMKGSTYPAKKALAQSARLGSSRLRRAMELLARADLDLRGRTAQDGGAVLEVLVARLAALSAPRRGRRAGAAR
jgi:DNA polymerase-3 subunit delta